MVPPSSLSTFILTNAMTISTSSMYSLRVVRNLVKRRRTTTTSETPSSTQMVRASAGPEVTLGSDVRDAYRSATDSGDIAFFRCRYVCVFVGAYIEGFQISSEKRKRE